MITTSLEKDTVVISHEGTSGCSVTLQKTKYDNGPVIMAEVEAYVDSAEEGYSMVASLLIYIEQLYGEGFVAECIGLYATKTHKKTYREHGQNLTMIRGEGQSEKKSYWEEPAP